ncbi:hypothetical protein K504DRAFT_287488 [Pleomassaria siparia CBS 279.74]|uniref:Uncharacterized protein n=1 Tax=Pleomassaria siparia CBS 279.74 TaxID=1314801 RepID=A0A6G1K836_9PLEO|nr:hypothetical protein K504DRAFT_287488 [Pleomassaria siparia CBS 279.74]
MMAFVCLDPSTCAASVVGVVSKSRRMPRQPIGPACPRPYIAIHSYIGIHPSLRPLAPSRMTAPTNRQSFLCEQPSPPFIPKSEPLPRVPPPPPHRKGLFRKKRQHHETSAVFFEPRTAFK